MMGIPKKKGGVFVCLIPAMYAHQTRRRWGHTAMRGWAKLAIDRRCLAGGEPSAWSAPPKTVDEDPDEAGALLDLHFTNAR
jgi:hypothetical protein